EQSRRCHGSPRGVPVAVGRPRHPSRSFQQLSIISYVDCCRLLNLQEICAKILPYWLWLHRGRFRPRRNGPARPPQQMLYSFIAVPVFLDRRRTIYAIAIIASIATSSQASEEIRVSEFWSVTGNARRAESGRPSLEKRCIHNGDRRHDERAIQPVVAL